MNVLPDDGGNVTIALATLDGGAGVFHVFPGHFGPSLFDFFLVIIVVAFRKLWRLENDQRDESRGNSINIL